MKLRAFVLAALIILVTGAGLAAGAVVQEGTLRVTVNAGLSPKRLPRNGEAPIAVSVGWRVATTDGSAPPKLKRLGIAINRNGHFDFAGMPVCREARIQPGSSAHALSACRKALVGRGRYSATVSLQGQAPYEVKGRLLVFNSLLHGRPVLLGHIYSSRPFANSFVIVFAVGEHAHGTYGTTLDATLPRALSAWGNLTGIQMTLSRRFSFKGKRHSYVSAGCHTPKGVPAASFKLARTTFSFTDGRALGTTVGGECRARG
jgi:hypothetical protein